MRSATVRMLVVSLAAAAASLAAKPAMGAWIEGGWPYRRAVDVIWNEKQPPIGDELACVRIYTAGGHVPSGTSIRVATEDGRVAPSHVLSIGPGDTMRVVFTPARGVRRHYIYFGHANPPAAPRGTDDVAYRCGLVLELRKYRGPLPRNFRQLETAWGQAKEMIGRTMVGRIHQGFNPLSQDIQTIARFSGALVAMLDGEYTFAGSASDCGAVYVDGKQLLWIPSGPADTRFNAKVQLGRGRHEITAYYVNVAGEQRLTLVWKQPGMGKFELVPPEAFGGVMLNVVSGVLEQRERPVMADMKIEYAGESFFSDHYTHRYRFTAQGSRAGIAPRCEWDFGDGQVASGPSVEHVFLTDEEYAVALKARVGGQTETRTNRVAVSRLWEQIASPPSDLPMTQAKLVAQYDPARLPGKSLAWAVLLLARARELQPLDRFAATLARTGGGVDAETVEDALTAAADQLAADRRFDAASRIWDAVPADAPCQPSATKQFARLLLWRMGEFNRAVKALDPQVRKHATDAELRGLYGQALLLDQRAAEAKTVLETLPAQGPADRRSALSGALARTIEFYVMEGDCVSGEQAWEKWQQQYPADFLEGYSVLLRTRLMELAKASEAAAKVAEAFALAAPRSSYSPRLLDRASSLLEKSNPAKSKALRQMLKQKYPEDPLSR